MAWNEVGLIRVKLLGNLYYRYLWFCIRSRDGRQSIRYRASMTEVELLIDMLNAKAGQYGIGLEVEHRLQYKPVQRIPPSSKVLSSAWQFKSVE